VIVFGASETFWISIIALACMGVADVVSVFIRHNLVQLITPDDMRGRVGAAVGVFVGASNELGEFESGVTAHWFGTVPAVVAGGRRGRHLRLGDTRSAPDRQPGRR
jgi:hypothetical protein